MGTNICRGVDVGPHDNIVQEDGGDVIMPIAPTVFFMVATCRGSKRMVCMEPSSLPDGEEQPVR